MFEYMTTQAARIDHTHAMAHLDEIGAHVPARTSRWARVVARIRHTAPMAPVVTLPAPPAMAGPDAGTVAA